MITLKQAFKRIINEVNEDNLVKHWIHMYEDANGNWGSSYQEPEKVCRYCIVGHVNRYIDNMSYKQKVLWNKIHHRTRVSLSTPHTVAQVKKIFKTWLKQLEA